MTHLMPLVAFLQAHPDQWFTRAQLVEAGLKGHHRHLDVTLRNTTRREIVRAASARMVCASTSSGGSP